MATVTPPCTTISRSTEINFAARASPATIDATASGEAHGTLSASSSKQVGCPTADDSAAAAYSRWYPEQGYERRGDVLHADD